MITLDVRLRGNCKRWEISGSLTEFLLKEFKKILLNVFVA